MLLRLRQLSIHLFVLAGSVPSGAVAQTNLWTGGGANSDWTTGANWQAGTKPAYDSAVAFGGTTRLNPNLNYEDFAFYVSGITFNAGAGAFSIGSNQGSQLLIKSGGITNNSSSLQTLSLPVFLNSLQTWNTAAGDLLVSGSVTSAGGIIKTGSGTLTLTGFNDYRGDTYLNAGTLRVASNSNLGAYYAGVGDPALLFGGGTLQLTGSFDTSRRIILNAPGGTIDTNGNSQAIQSAISGDGRLTKTGAGTLSLNATNSYTGGTTIKGGVVAFNSLGSFGTGNVTLDGGGVRWAAGNTADLSPRLTAFGSGGGTFDTNGNTVSFAGALTGGGPLTKAGAGTLSLGAPSTYTGGTTVAGGVLQLLGSTSSPSFAIASGAALDVNVANGVSTALPTMAFSGTGTLRKSGAGTLHWPGSAATFALGSGSRIEVNGGTFVAGSSGNEVWTNNLSDLHVAAGALFHGVEANVRVNALSGDGRIQSGYRDGAGYSTFTFGVANGSGTFNGVLADTDSWHVGHFTKAGTGTQILAGTNTYSGGTTIAAGTLQIGNGGTSGSILGHVVNQGTLAFNRSDAATFAGAISGSGGVTQAGTGTLTLTGANSYTGTTRLLAGTLSLGSASALGGTGLISFEGGTLQYSAANTNDYVNGFSRAAGQLYRIDTNGQNVMFSSSLQSDGGSLTKLGAGTLTLSVANTYTGATTVAAGTLALGANHVIADTSAVTVAAGATFDVGGRTETIGSLAGAGAVSLGSGRLTAGLDETSTTFSGQISGTGTFIKTGPGTLTLTGAASHTGGTLIDYGTLLVGPGGSLGGLVTNDGSLVFNRPDTFTQADVIRGVGRVTQAGPGAIVLTGNNTFSGGLTVQGGTVEFSALENLGTGTLTMAGGTLRWATGSTTDISPIVNPVLGSGQSTFDTNGNSVTIATGFSGSGTLVKSGLGGLTLAAPSDRTGPTLLANGVLQITTPLALQYSTVSFQGGGLGFSSINSATLGGLSGENPTTRVVLAVGLTALDLTVGGNNESTAFAGVLTGKGSLTKIGTGWLTLTGANSFSGGTTIAAGTLRIGDGGTTGLIGSVVNDGTLVFHRSDNFTYGGIISGTGSLVKFGAGELTLSSRNTFTGTTTVAAGKLILGHASALVGSTLDVPFSSQFSFGTLSTANLGGLTGSNNLALVNASSAGVALNVGYNDDSTTYSGALTGAGSLTKVGTGTLTLSGNSTYTGGTTVREGTLALGASHRLSNTGNLTVAGGTFSLEGFNETVANLVLQSGSITGPGTLTGTSFDVRAGTVAANLAGTGTLTKSGAGNATLSGTNTYTGGTIVNAGTLSITSNAQLGNSTGSLAFGGGTLATTGSFTTTRAVALNANGLFSPEANTTLTLGGTVSGTGALVMSGLGTLALTGTKTYSGGTVVNSGTLEVPGNAQLGNSSGGVTLGGGTLRLAGSFASARAVTLDSAGGTFDTNGFDLALSGVLAGPAGFAKSGAGNLTLSGANTFAGPIAVNAGTLTLGASHSLPDSAEVTIAAGASLDLANRTDAVASLAGGGSIALGSGALTLNGATSTNFAGTVNGAGSLTYSGSGTLTLSGANAFSGGTTLVSGTLAVGHDSALGTGTLRLAGGTLQSATAARTLTNAITLTGPATIGGANTLTLSGAIAEDGGTFGLTKLGSGTLRLQASNTFTGGLTVSEGTVVASADSALGSGPLTITGGSLSLSASQSVSSLSGTGGGINLGSGRSLTVNQTDNVSFAGVISGAGTLVKSGPGQLRLSAANTFSGGTSLASGSLFLAHPTALGTGALTITGGTLQSTGGLVLNNPVRFSGNVTFTADAPFLQGGVTLTQTPILTVDAGTAVGIAGAITQSGGAFGLTKAGGGVLILSGTNTYSGPTTIQAGMIAVASNANLGIGGGVAFGGGTLRAGASFTAARATTLDAGGGTFDVLSGATLTWSGNISGAAGNSLTKIGPGTLLLAGTNTYAGDTRVLAGTLKLGSAGALSPNSRLNVAAGATFDANGFSPSFADLSGAGSIAVGTGGLSVAPSGTSSFTGTLSGPGGLTVGGSGTMVLGAPNFFTGAATLNSGTLRLAAAGALPNQIPVQIAAGATLDLGGRAATLGRLSGAGSIALSNSTLTIAQSTTTQFTGGIVGSGNLVKSGSGTLTLSGNQAYSGTTTISGGQLKLLGSAAGSAFTVTGGILSGSGTVGALTIGSGGTLSPGTSPGTFHAGNTVWAGGGSLVWEINHVAGTAGAHPGWDLLAISGTLSVTATPANRFSVHLTSLADSTTPGNVANFDPAQNYTFNFVTASSGLSGFSPAAFTLDTSAFSNAFSGTWSIASTGGGLSLHYTASAVPEPSTYAALCGAAALACAAWRRRRRT